VAKNKFYTRAGDEGYSRLLGSEKVPKEDERLEAIGAVDEANAVIGIARSLARSPEAPGTLLQIQRDLYGLMAELAAAPENAARFRSIDGQRLSWLEAEIDQLAARVEIPEEFIAPGDVAGGAFMDFARTVVRKAERRVAQLLHHGAISNLDLLRYLNRLSSYCFLLELRETLFVKQAAGTDHPTITLVKNG